jgi:hypothetical protein
MKVIKLRNTSDNINWKKIYVTSKPIEADIVRGNLESEGITVVNFNKRDSSYTTFGDVELYVPEDEYDIALKLIEGVKYD